MSSGPDPLAAIAILVAIYGGLLLLVVAGTVLWVVALLDCVRREFKDPSLRLVWAIVIVATHALGAILYMLIGRGQGFIPVAGTTFPASPPPPSQKAD